VRGVVISEITADSPHNRTLARGVVILRVNGRDVNSVADVRAAIQPGVNRLYVFHRGNYGFIAVRVQ
jgi:S1-C subfamily serine protease